MLDVGEYKGIIFLLLILLGLLIVQRRGPTILLYLAALFAWYGKNVQDWGPLQPFLEGMTIPECAVLGAFVFSLRGRYTARVPFLLVLLGVLVLAFLVWAFGISPDNRFAWHFIRKCLLVPTLAYVAALRLLNSSRKRDMMMLCIMLGSTMLSALGLLSALNLFSWNPGTEQLAYTRSFRLFHSIQLPILGSYRMGGNISVVFSSLAVPMLLVLYLSASKNDFRTRLLAVLGILVAMGSILVTGCRAPILGSAASCLLVVFFCKRQKLSRRVSSGIQVTLFFLFLGFILYENGLLSEDSFLQFRGMSQLFDAPLNYIIESNHGVLWKEFYSVAQHYPFGAGYFPTLHAFGGPDHSPHAQYAYIYLATGLPGLMFFFGVLFLTMLNGFRCPLDHRGYWTMTACAAAMVTLFFSFAMVHTVIVDGADLTAFLLAAVIMRYSRYRSPQVGKLGAAPGQRAFLGKRLSSVTSMNSVESMKGGK